MTHDGPDDADEQELAELLWLAPDDPRRERALARDPRLARRLADLERVRAALDEEAARRDGAPPVEPAARAAEERALATFARRVDAEAGAGAALPTRSPRHAAGPGEAAVRDPSAPHGAGHGSQARRWLLAAVAVAAALLVAVRTWPTSTRAQVWLGAHVPGASGTPLGPTADWSEFTWSPAPPPGSVHVVRARAAPNTDARVDVESPPCTNPTWTPSPEQRDALGAEFVWQVWERNPIDGTERLLFDARVVAPS